MNRGEGDHAQHGSGMLNIKRWQVELSLFHAWNDRGATRWLLGSGWFPWCLIIPDRFWWVSMLTLTHVIWFQVLLTQFSFGVQKEQVSIFSV